MSIRIRTIHVPAEDEVLGVVVERLEDGFFYDFATLRFKEFPQQASSDRMRRLGPNTIAAPTGYGITLPGDGYVDGYHSYTVHVAKLVDGAPGPLSAPVDSGYFLALDGSDSWSGVRAVLDPCCCRRRH